jgi:hypothetical protein
MQIYWTGNSVVLARNNQNRGAELMLCIQHAVSDSYQKDESRLQ